MSDAPDDLGIPTKPTRNNSGQNATVAPLGRVPPPSPVPARPADPPRTAPEPLRPAEAGPRVAAPLSGSPLAASPLAPPRRNDADLRKMIVGREITLSGEINSCDRLIIEGSVEANLQNCTEVELAETGLFKGSATIDEIEVRGRFEGNLTVRKRLLIRATGRVSGTIRYGQIEIECGGQISGDVQASAGDEPLAMSESRAAL
ncbi:MAG TPA: polymer-forming cytoskeletal protein [Stellaceae bacterium]|nr:polymer-forming cytoskeletal protein [Stellaceae bacterium]